MIVWLEKELVMAIHDRQLAEHGGSSGLRDESLLESALARPQQLHAYGGADTDLASLAASLAYGLARNHPFVDGNKRTAFVACRVFLRLNEADYIATAKTNSPPGCVSAFSYPAAARCRKKRPATLKTLR